MNIKEMSVEKLKAMAYDFMADGQRIQHNLQAINNEIASRKPEPKEEKKEEPKE